jgi:glycosyltransferase involved in cell wall biosynthesis
MRTAEYVKNAKHKKILVAEDCRTLYQQRSYEESNRWLQKLVRFWDYKKLRAYEPHITGLFDLVTLVTNEDIEAMKQLNPKASYRLLTNGVDINKFVPPIDDSQRHGIIFTGKLDLWANILMIETIVKRILPAIREEVPGCDFTIVGAKPTQAVISIARYNKNVRLITEVPEMYPYLQNAEIFVHPHSSGSGIQNKLLEAMACGCPVVTTPTGNQGINARDGIEAMIGQDLDEIIEKSIQILKDKELSRNIAANARELIVNTHSWPMVFDALDGIINELHF